VVVTEFEAVSRQIQLAPSVELPGRIWASGQPTWIPDVTKENRFPRAPFAAQAGLHGAFGFPILLGREVLGVIEFFSHEIREPDKDLLAMMATIGGQIGQFIDRKRAEQQLCESEKRFQAERQQSEEKLRQTEEQFRQVQKMEAIGRLAGGVAHDFNNLLTIILGYSDLMLGKLDPGDSMRELIVQIKSAGDRAASLTRQLLAFSRQQVLAPKILDLNVIVTDTEKMLRRLIGEDITLATALDPRLGLVKADPGQIEQVIMNLVVNARDAMPEGGKLTIETRNVELDEIYAQGHPEVRRGDYAMLGVSDTGCGMDETIKARIFEPFFTTKGAGKGTGLGLATVYGIVKQSGGSIYVYSEVGRGTSFKIYLPLVEEKIPSAKCQTDLRKVPPGKETLLLVEDEEAVRAITRHVLQLCGYTILEASHGAEAIKICENNPGPIHLLMTDVVMPGMGGRQLAETLLSRQPDMKVLYLSGYTDDAVVRHGVLEAGANFLQKPFTPGSLAQKVREILDRKE
jgi:signal transduction histidine kinase